LQQYHWRPHHGTKQFNFEQTLMTQGVDPDYAKRELYETIDKGGSFKWTMMIQVSHYSQRTLSLTGQVMTPEQAANVSFDPFDVTKVWPRGKRLARV
jgi:catalase